jgi:hypothetical protein
MNVLATILAVGLFALSHAGAAIIEYDADPGPAPNPASIDGYPTKAGNQPWTYNSGAGSRFSAIDDGGTPAWAQNTTGTGSYAMYYLSPDVADANEGAANGWELEVEARIPTTSLTPSFGSAAGYWDGAKRWHLMFGAEADGDPIVKLADGGNPTYTLQGAGNTGYHTYKLVYDSAAGTADLFVDGNEVISNWAGGAATTTLIVRWGDDAFAEDAQVNWNHVKWETVPEPAAILLVTIGGFFALRRRRTR